MLYSESQHLKTHKTGEAIKAKNFGIGQEGMVPWAMGTITHAMPSDVFSLDAR